ncbi:MAG: SDR family NAD(P)-dependent oxidoreductase [Planctomycetaceae bacterium]|nr:SDR family NAD(P)-dependent oxidoreductase [Planctomycetaceae bacterium]
MKRGIVIGASSGIGRALVDQLVAEDYHVVAIARRVELLEELQRIHAGRVTAIPGDVSNPESIRELLESEFQTNGPIELIVNCAGVGFLNQELEWKPEQETIRVNVEGFAAISGIAVARMIEQGSGIFVNISSIAALRGNAIAPAYNASKAFESNYMEGLRVKVRKLKLPISIIDIQPGFVDTAMAQGDQLFWVATPKKAAEQIVRAIKRRRSHAYVTRRWRLFAWLLKVCPDWLYWRIG